MENWKLEDISSSSKSNSKLHQKKKQGGVIFHVLDRQSNTYSEFFVSKVNSGRFYLSCCKRKCNTSLVLTLGPLIEVNEVPSNTKNKKYELDSSVTDVILKDIKNYGPIVHVCRVGCTDKHLALCSKTRHREDTACAYPANQYIKRRTIEESVAAHERSMSSRSTSDLYKEAKLLVERTTDFDSSIWGAGHHHGVTYSMVRNTIKNSKKRLLLHSNYDSNSVPPALKYVRFAPSFNYVQVIYNQFFFITNFLYRIRNCILSLFSRRSMA